MGQFFVLRGGRAVNTNGHWRRDDADRAALATLRRHPKSTCHITEVIGTLTLESAEEAARNRVASRPAPATGAGR